MYLIEIEHRGLNKHRVIRGREEAIVERKAQLQLAAWEEQWQQVITRRTAQMDRENKAAEAAARSAAARRSLGELQSILADTLRVDDAIDWESLKRYGSYPHPAPDEPIESLFAPRITFLDHILPYRKGRKILEGKARYDQAIGRWRRAMAEWESERDKFARHLREQNTTVEAQKARYMSGDPGAIAEYCDLVLSRSSYPSNFPQEFQVDYEASGKIAVIDYQLPTPAELPRLSEVRYVSSRGEFKETYIKEAESKSIYDDVVYQISLRTVHEIFEADRIDAITAAVFNGWVHYVDPRTGHDTRSCIASLQASKAEFSRINLRAVSPKECFRALKGVAAATLSSMAPVAPILQLNKDDPRFVPGKDVIGGLEAGTNIATIGWEEFEHLVREVFSAELSVGGGEVKVTQASRDGGVDAIAFDPDPIRGGKIVSKPSATPTRWTSRPFGTYTGR